MKLEVGMYLRTKYGIAKYLHEKITLQTTYYVVDKDIVFCNVENWEDTLTKNEILKASNNIIDLIEVGDYVNGYKTERVDEPCKLNPYGSLKYRQNENCDYEDILGNEIKSIVTKEQFESMSYKL